MNLILAKIRAQSEIALACASSGIAATLLPGGRTAHSTFKIPLNLQSSESPVCGISRNSKDAELLRRATIIVLDECSMLNKRAFEAIDRLMQDLRGNSQLMGGVTFVAAGDFRQCLPVITGGTSADQLRFMLKSSHLWHSVTVSYSKCQGLTFV